MTTETQSGAMWIEDEKTLGEYRMLAVQTHTWLTTHPVPVHHWHFYWADFEDLVNRREATLKVYHRDTLDTPVKSLVEHCAAASAVWCDFRCFVQNSHCKSGERFVRAMQNQLNAYYRVLTVVKCFWWAFAGMAGRNDLQDLLFPNLGMPMEIGRDGGLMLAMSPLAEAQSYFHDCTKEEFLHPLT